jgi:peptide deformylase
LKRPCGPPTDDEVELVLQDLIDTMRAHPGCVGLAACQIGQPVRVAVVDVRGHRLADSDNGLLALVDAAIEERAGGHVAREGCLSLPAFTADVKRARRIRLSTRTLDGDVREVWSAGFEARAVQHELDHLDGVLILDRVTSVRALHPRLVQPGTSVRPPARLPVRSSGQ